MALLDVPFFFGAHSLGQAKEEGKAKGSATGKESGLRLYARIDAWTRKEEFLQG